MQRYKGVIEYFGTKYSGMQRQDNLKTVQGTVESALKKFMGGMELEIDFCGRTDAGVHAFGQVIHFDLPQNRTTKQTLEGINYFLNIDGEDVVIKSVEAVDLMFHSRFSCKGREYKYYIYNAPIRSPIFRERMYHVTQSLDINKMQKAANLLIGEHDFSSFRGRGCQAKSPIKTINFININKINKDIIEIHIGAKSFLYRMVRNITGLLVYNGLGKIQDGDVLKILEVKNVDALPYTAPSHGLYFFKALY